jgi:hypothetical protein
MPYEAPKLDRRGRHAATRGSPGREMPALVDIIEATPRCDARRMIRRGQWGVHFTCYAPMWYRPDANHWLCSACGRDTPAERVVMLSRLHAARLAGAA